MAFILYLLMLATGVVLWLISRRKTLPVKARHKPFDNDFAVTDKEYNQLKTLYSRLRCKNQFAREQTLTLYFTVKRKFSRAVKANELIMISLCECMALKQINYMPNLYHQAPRYKSLLNHDNIYNFVESQAQLLVPEITGQESRKFYSLNKDAWEVRYEQLQSDFDPGRAKEFYEEVCRIGQLNSTRLLTARKIFIQAHHFLADKNRDCSLRCYLHYLNQRSDMPFNNHQKLSKKNCIVLFREAEEQQKFQKICWKLVRSGNLEKAMTEFDELKLNLRKKITLDANGIKAAAAKLNKVAGVLGTLLADEEEEPVKQEAVVQQPPENINNALMNLFINQSFCMNKEEVDIFAQSRGYFGSQLIERINETYYENLDDVLIEEDDNCYSMNENYYQQIRENGN